MNKKSHPIIEKVSNIQGSTAGAGSGEYHRYRSMRRKEKAIEAALEKEKNDEFQKKMSDVRKQLINNIFEAKTTRNRRKREQKKKRRRNNYKSNKDNNNDESISNNSSIRSDKHEITNEFDNKIIKLNENKIENVKKSKIQKIEINDNTKLDNHIILQKENTEISKRLTNQYSDKSNNNINQTNENNENNKSQIEEKIDEDSFITLNTLPHESLILTNLNKYVKNNISTTNNNVSKNKLIINDLDD